MLGSRRKIVSNSDNVEVISCFRRKTVRVSNSDNAEVMLGSRRTIVSVTATMPKLC